MCACAGFSLHASVHAARPDVRCVLHVRAPAALAVSATRRGLLPLCAEAALLGDVAYHRVPDGQCAIFRHLSLRGPTLFCHLHCTVGLGHARNYGAECCGLKFHMECVYCVICLCFIPAYKILCDTSS